MVGKKGLRGKLRGYVRDGRVLKAIGSLILVMVLLQMSSRRIWVGSWSAFISIVGGKDRRRKGTSPFRQKRPRNIVWYGMRLMTNQYGPGIYLESLKRNTIGRC